MKNILSVLTKLRMSRDMIDDDYEKTKREVGMET